MDSIEPTADAWRDIVHLIERVIYDPEIAPFFKLVSILLALALLAWAVRAAGGGS